MVVRTLRHLVQILGGLGAGLAVLMVVLAWQLSSGPISLAFLTPYFEKVLNNGSRNLTIRLDDTILTWAGWGRTLDIRVVNVRAFKEDGVVVATVPELSLSLSARALVDGMIAPKRIELFRPRMQFVHRREGGFELWFADGENGAGHVFDRILEQLMAEPSAEHAMGYLTHLNVIDADLTIIDHALGTRWNAPKTQVRLQRDENGLKGDVDLTLIVPGGRDTRLRILGGYDIDNAAWNSDITVSDVVPADFASLSPKLGQLGAVDVPLDGTVTLNMNEDGLIGVVGFDFVGGAGTLLLPEPVTQSLKIEGVALNGTYDVPSGVLDVDTFYADLGDKGSFLLPEPTNHVMPAHSVSISGSYDLEAGEIDIREISADLQGPQLTVSGNIEGFGGAMSIRAEASLFKVPADELAVYWPQAWGEDPHKWCTKNLSKGIVNEATAAFSLKTNADGSLASFDINGSMDIADVTVNYLPPMPKVHGVSGRATFDKHAFHVDATSGSVNGLSLSNGNMHFADLQDYDQWADIALTIEGPFKEAMHLVDHKPLGFASKLGFDPAESSGLSRTNLRLRFPLIDELTFEQVEVEAAAALADVSMKGVVADMDMSGADLELRVDKDQLDVTGTGSLQSVPVGLTWTERFKDDTPIRSHYRLNGWSEVGRLAQDFGLSMPPFTGGYIEGPVGAEVVYTIGRDHMAKLDAVVDLSRASMKLDTLNWQKSPEQPASAHVTVDVQDNRLKRISTIEVTAPDLSALGSIDLSEDGGKLSRIDLETLKVGRNDIRGLLIPGADGGWTASLHGPSLDVSPFMDSLTGTKPANKDTDTDQAPFSLSADIDRVWISENEVLTNVIGTLSKTNDMWRRIILDGDVNEGGKPFAVRLEPGDGGNRHLRIQADDAGALLKTLGYYEYMKGGILYIDAKFDDGAPTSPLDGRLLIKDYRITQAPGLARLVSILSLTGIFDALQGEGVGFATLDAPFRFEDGVLQINEAKASGVSLGYTASGRIYTHAEMIDVEGTVVPAYAINSALGRIPLIGPLFSGGEEGSGVFAATYRMEGPLETPDVTVNPLSTFAPGFLRNLFGIFDNKNAPSAGEGDIFGPVPKGGALIK